MRVGENCYLVLKNGLRFSGEIIDLNDKSITIIDKFSHEVILSRDELTLIEVKE